MRVPSESSAAAVRSQIQPGVWLDSRLALWLEAGRVLVVADLHWGYAASHRARGNLLPAWGDDEIEARLGALLREYQPAEMLWLGDVVHATEGAARADAFLRSSPVPTTVLAGNHDRRWRVSEPTAQRGRFFLHHGDRTHPVPAGCVEVIGHHHPALSWSDGAGGNLKLPALVAGPTHLTLPAFSPWAAGADCGHLLTPASVVWAIAPRRIFAVLSPQRISAAP